MKTPQKFTVTHIEWYDIDGGIEIEYEVTGTVTPVIPAKTWGSPEHCYPQEGGEVEILSVKEDGKEVPLDSIIESVQDEMCEKLFEAACEDDSCDDEGPDPDRAWDERFED